MNEFEIMLVQKDLQDKGFVDWQLKPGNDCVWAMVQSGNIWLDFYYIFREGRIADIQVD